MKDLQLVLFILGAIAIIVVLVHGFWSIRKQQPKSMKQSPMAGFYKDQAKRLDANGFDSDGIGKVRVRKTEDVEQPVSKPILKTNLTQKNATPTDVEASLSDTPLKDSLHKYESASKPEPSVATKAAQPTQQTLFVEDDDNHASATVSSAPTSMNMPKKIVNAATTRGTLTSYSDTQSGDSPSTHTKSEPKKSVPIEPVEPEVTAEVKTTTNDEPSEPTDVLVLHVVAKAGAQIQGAELLPSLLSLNFKFGDMDIFHRHIDNAGTGKVLFSLANMLKPGVFDPDQMEQFETQGVVLFMTLPGYGDPLMNFTIMLNSAYQIADDLDAELLDGQRQPWTDETQKEYQRRLNEA